jgi:hypothetical protein
MSGVNRNILKNTAIPVMGEGPTNLDVLNSGSRFLLINFPPTFLSSSNGGSCTGITLQWTPDPSFGFETSSAYYAVTQSNQNCEPYSLNPLTASIGYTQFINSSYTSEPSTYYIRAFQNKVGGGRGPYSDIVEVNLGRDSGGYTYNFDTKGFNPIDGNWYSAGTSGSLGQVAAWTGSTQPQIIKYGGPQYDAIRTYGATFYIPMAAYTLGSPPWQVSIGIANGSATFSSQPNNIGMTVTATTSSIANNGENVVGAQTSGWMKSGINTFNTVIGFSGGGGSLSQRNGVMLVDGVNVSTPDGRGYTTREGGDYASGWISIQTSADCILRCFTVGNLYDPIAFHNLYGPAGQAYYPQQLSVTGSSVLPIASASVVNLYSDFGYPTTIAYNNLVLTTSSLNPNNDPNYSYQITNSGSGWYDMNEISSKIITITGSLTTSSANGLGFNGTTDNLTILSSSLAGIQNNYTVQFIGTLPGTSSQLNALFGNPDYQGVNAEDVIYRNDGLPASASIDFRTVLTGGVVSVNRYTIPNINTSSLQLLTFMSSGSTFKVYNGLNELPVTTIGGGVPNFTGSFNLFDNMTVNGRGIYFGYNNDVDTNNYSGSLHNLLIYSRSLSDAELSSSFQYFQSI